jgi:hypothetical protein
MKRIRFFNKKQESIYHQLERKERRLLNYLEVLYGDMSLAVGMGDRLKIEKQVSDVQRQLEVIRKQKRVVIRRMRKMADKIGADERDRLVRKGRIEDKVGLDQNTHIRRDIENNQKKLLAETKVLAQKYATMAATIAASKKAIKVNKDKSGNIMDAQHSFKKVAKKAYNQMYKTIVERIEAATAEGVSNEEIKIVCRDAISGIIRKLEHDNLIYVVSRQEAKKEGKQAIKTPLKNAAKTLTKKFNKANKLDDKVIKKAEKKGLKKLN